MYGTQTCDISTAPEAFENDVKMYGTQTHRAFFLFLNPFENDVKMYGTQTKNNKNVGFYCLRMM